MIENENKTIIIMGGNENGEAIPVIEQDMVLHEQEISNGIITVPIALEVKVPKGFRWCEEQPIAFGLAVDIHNIYCLVSLVQQPTDNSLPVYYARLAGTLSYNLLLTGFTPISGRTILIEGSATGANSVFSDLPCKSAFSRTAQRNISEALGYVNRIEQVEYDLTNNFYIDVVIEEPTVILPDGTILDMDPTDPEAFYGIFDGSNDFIYVANFSIIANTRLGFDS